ncbi:MAG: hypothetical protein KDK70_18965 [Myxococcales bacterium]|nr:hypothetical protein [Myxococcales bacterium]
MNETRCKSANPDLRGATRQTIGLNADWTLTLNDDPPVNRQGEPVSITLEHGDRVIIGVSAGSTLSTFDAVLIDPNGNRHELGLASGTDGQTVQVQSGSQTRTVNVKLVDENDLPG